MELHGVFRELYRNHDLAHPCCIPKRGAPYKVQLVIHVLVKCFINVIQSNKKTRTKYPRPNQITSSSPYLQCYLLYIFLSFPQFGVSPGACICGGEKKASFWEKKSTPTYGFVVAFFPGDISESVWVRNVSCINLRQSTTCRFMF